MVLNVAWMLTVVALPVATAMVGSVPTDRPQIAVYVGTMLLNSVVMTAICLVVPAPGAAGATLASGHVTRGPALGGGRPSGPLNRRPRRPR